MKDIFKKMDRDMAAASLSFHTEALKKWGIKKQSEKYILARILKSMDCRIEAMDEEVYSGMCYLNYEYERVCKDVTIPEEERNLCHIIDKIEDDILFDFETYYSKAIFALNFLETDLLCGIIDTRTDKGYEEPLGKIHRIRNMSLGHMGKQISTGNNDADILKPAKLKAYLDDYIIGQEDAKKIICSAVYGHYKRIRNPNIKLPNNVILLIGPSGCGKSEIMRKIRDELHLPMVFTDVSSLGASQYRGRHKEDILLALLQEAGQKKDLAECGVIFMDEFDKVLLPAFSEKGINMHDDVQSQLLTMLEGSDVELKTEDATFTMNTSKILFVLAGAFQGIDEFIREDKLKKSNVSGTTGFLATPTKEMDLSFVRENINHEVLMEYGMKRELAGRISSIAVLEKLDHETVLRILKEPKDSILERYSRELELSSGAKLEVTPEALDAIAEEVIASPVGARAIFSILRRCIRDSLYEAPGMKGITKIQITEDTVKNKVSPKYIRFDEMQE